MPCVLRSSSAFAWVAASGDVFTMTLRPGYSAISSLATRLAWNTTPAVQPWSAAGIDTPIVFLSAAWATLIRAAMATAIPNITLRISVSLYR